MFFATLRIFLWKHYKSMRMSWVSVLMNIGLPIGMLFLSMYLYNAISQAEQDHQRSEVDLISRSESLRLEEQTVNFDHLYYAPNTTDDIRDVLERVRKKLQKPHDSIIGFATDAELTAAIQLTLTASDVAVRFAANFGSSGAGQQQQAYTISMADDGRFHTEQRYVNDFFAATSVSYDPYVYSGFSQLQWAIDEALLAHRAATTKQSSPSAPPHIDLRVQQLPSAIREHANFSRFALFAQIAWVIYVFVLVNMVLVPVVEEKELGIREFLRIATSYYQLNLFTFSLLHVLIGVFIFGVILAIASFYQLTQHFSILCAIILIALYAASAIANALLVSVLFNTVFFAKNGGHLLLFVPWAIQFYEPMRFVTPIVSSVMFCDGWKIFDAFGARAQHFGFGQLFEHVDASQSAYTMFEVWLFLALDTAIYAALYTYLVQVFPGTYGTPEPFYFPVLRVARWLSGGRAAQDSTDAGREESLHSVATKEDVVVRVRGLTKDFSQLFGESLRAVNNVSMDIRRNQISVLLGHNGAGKTTTMSIISGIVAKTRGEIVVNGEKDVNVYRKNIGYCPQHNVFLPYFTCKDHLQFFGVLRGLSAAEARTKSRNLLERLNLLDKANEYGKDLSGGMKRRLCLGNALIGDTKIAILDEPSSGLDPESRREFWNILIEMRKHNTILITTHYMEEAETLADYILIMSRGEILCHGTALQLKRRYAEGYVLKLMTGERFETETLMKRLRTAVPNATIKSFVRPTLCVTLPYEHFKHYARALKDLEDHAAELGIESISLTDASLEEVFLNSDPQKHTPEVQETLSNGSDQVDANSYSPLNENKLSGNCALWSQQWLAVFYKKFVFLRRHWIRLLVSVSLLLAVLIFCLRTSNEPTNAKKAAAAADETRSIGEVRFSPRGLRDGEILLHVPASVNGSEVRRFEEALQAEVLLADGVTIRRIATAGTLESALLAIEAANIPHYHERILLVLSLQQKPDAPLSATILYAGNVLHSIPRSINLVTNTLARMQTTATTTQSPPTPLQLTTINSPTQLRYRHLVRDDTDSYGSDGSPASSLVFEWYKILIPAALFFYMLFYVYMPFAETSTEFKQLQIIAPSLYWLAYYVFDLLLHLLICLLLFAVHLLVDRAHVFTAAEHAQLVSLYVQYGATYLPMCYVIAQICNTQSTIYSVLTYLFVIPAIPAMIFTLSPQTLEQYATWVAVLLVLPDYALRQGISVFLMVHPGAASVAQDGVLSLDKVYVYQSVVAVVLLAFLVLVLENIYRREVLVQVLRLYRPILRALRCNRGRQQVPVVVLEDGGSGAGGAQPLLAVEEEKRRTEAVMAARRMADYAIVVSKLRKVYDGLVAVRGLDFTVRRGECFGLLGMNGAGKSTTFKMMVRDLPITEGEIYFKGVESRKEPTRYKRMFGYCPQVDALNGWMTGYETLKYMGMARGTRLADLDGEVRKLLRSTDLEQYAEVVVSKYSGGTKRKLNTAMAVQTDPLLVFLDEPTTGVDPSSRRFMWACMQECQRQNKNIVLTSHSMDECEFLCNRLAIMNHGQLNCIGPIQQLKRSFGLGYLITVMLRDSHVARMGVVAELKADVAKQFGGVQREEYGNQLSFLVQNPAVCWSDVITRVVQLRAKYDEVLEDISLSESSLEDIFLKIARESRIVQAAAV